MTIRSADWYENSQFFSMDYIRVDTAFDAQKPKRTELECDGIESLLDKKSKLKILDCPCGFGRHSIELAKRGHDVTGIDLDPYFLSIAKKAAQRCRIPASFMRADMRYLQVRGEFDAVINMFWSFGFFKTDAENEQVIRNFYDVLKTNGTFILHTDAVIENFDMRYRSNPDIKIGKKFIDGQFYPEATLRREEEYDSATRSIYGTWQIIEKDGTAGRKRHYRARVYSCEEFKDLYKRAGFKAVHLIGDWKEPFQPHVHEDLIVVGKK